MGLYGALSQDLFTSFEPLRNDAADAFVSELGIPEFSKRSKDRIEDHGTSYLFVDPSFSPEELVWSIERNWWPLLETHRVGISVHDYTGENLEIGPRSRLCSSHSLRLSTLPGE